jgi:hypothetical protein
MGSYANTRWAGYCEKSGGLGFGFFVFGFGLSDCGFSVMY